jgi:3-methyladenine DNA glycosylase AlkD
MRTSTPEALIQDMRMAMEALADPDRAEAQRAYMKSPLPFYGISSPDLRTALRDPLRTHRLASFADWERAIRTLWDTAGHREEWYAALAIVQYRWYHDWRNDMAALPLFLHLIKTGAWWDVCDEIASRLIGPLLQAHRSDMTPILIDWAHDDHMWVRRVAILSQLKAKSATDRALLESTIEPNIGDREFFIRKGIGWALREFSKTDPVWVAEFVWAHEDRLSALSKKEALRLLVKTTLRRVGGG